MSKTALVIAAAALALPSLANAAETPISVRDSFRIGSEGTVYCSGQNMSTDRVLSGMFDRGYSVVCRDAAEPVGQIYALRVDGDPAARLASARAERVSCGATGQTALQGVGTVEVIECKLKSADLPYRVYQFRKGKLFYSAEGLAGYDSALKLGLHTVVSNKPVKGEVSIATTGAGDPAAFARVQAGTLDPTRALAEAYRRNNAGSYADSAEFFAAVSSSPDAPVSRAEGMVNEALQKSNLGRYAEADALFTRAEDLVANDPIVARQLRNYRAMHLLNQGQPADAVKELDKPLPVGAQLASNDAVAKLVIDPSTSKRLNAESPISRQLGGVSEDLLPEEKADILDGQAMQLRGAALRLQDKDAEASAAFVEANAKLAGVRGGNVSSVVWMRAQILGDRAAVAEHGGRNTEAEQLFTQSVSMLEASYPGSAALLSARARLAGFLARTGRTDAAEKMFAEVVKALADAGSGAPSLTRVLAPYAELLLKKGNNPEALGQFFEATQVMLRPGVAQTQAVLARELSGGSDDAARMFRQAVTLTRQVERAQVELKRLEAMAQPSPEDQVRARQLKFALARARKEQVETQARLANFPRFRAVSAETLSLPELQKLLREGEAYYKMTVVGDRVYALFATPKSARAIRIEAPAKQLETDVDALRETISVEEAGKRVTYAFDVGLARHLFVQLFQPIEAELAQVRHLIFEPDGAMLRLPPNLLLMSDNGIDAYRKRAAAGGDGEFDFTGLHWLGRDRDISTSVSARAFSEVRTAPPAAGTRQYLGLGQNSLPPPTMTLAAAATQDRDCVLSLNTWNAPISPTELQIAGGILGSNDPRNAQVLTGDAFTDTALMSRTDLNEYRIIHFATHGIVTPPQRKCPVQPALITSFGEKGSDGLLTFKEIFDLRLDADLVILSACDTASEASTAATRAAGLATGGDVALDGLVRAFVAAGGRLVVASHWPVPDDFNATQRLVTGLFKAPAGTSTATALRLSQRELMDDPATSHPFYWSAFASIGDGSAPVIRKPQAVASLAK
jgi:CHAT domain-containing protein